MSTRSSVYFSHGIHVYWEQAECRYRIQRRGNRPHWFPRMIGRYLMNRMIKRAR